MERKILAEIQKKLGALLILGAGLHLGMLTPLPENLPLQEKRTVDLYGNIPYFREGEDSRDLSILDAVQEPFTVGAPCAKGGEEVLMATVVCNCECFCHCHCNCECACHCNC